MCLERVCADIRLQQRNGRKTLTTVQGLNAYLDRDKIEKLIKIFKKVWPRHGRALRGSFVQC